VALYVTDTHALIWHAAGRARKLGRRARAAYAAAEEGRAAIYVPAVALVELLGRIRSGVLRPAMPVSDWLDALFGAGPYLFAPLTLEVIEAGETLHRIPERGDRLIVATALALGCPLITRDSAIEGVEVIW
jgi:PIN domain nuclease of toxin-antitoxin system